MELTMRNIKIHRLFFEIFDNMFIGKHEKEALRNASHFRNFIKKIAKDRRLEMAAPNY